MEASSNPLSVSASSPPEQIASASSLAASSAETVLRANAGSEISSVTSLDRVFDAFPSQDELELAGLAIQGLMQRHSPPGSENNQLLPRATPDQQTITMPQPVQQIFHSFNLVQGLPVAMAAISSLISDPELWNVVCRNAGFQAFARSLTRSDLSGSSTNVTGFDQGGILTMGEKGSGCKSELIAPTSPLYLHPSEQTSLSLTQIKFNGENYELWADAIKNSLNAKNKLAFVEGTIPKPETKVGEDESVEAAAWRQCNAMVKAWLRNAIEIKLLPNITFSLTVPEIWKELKERYATANAPRVHQLKAELSECKQEKGQSVVEYYTRLKSIWDELANFSRVPPCTCGAAVFFTKEREEERVHQFLMGLDTEKYGNLRSNLLMEDDVPPLGKAYGIVLREERHKAMTKGEEIIEAAMATRLWMWRSFF